MHIYDNVLKCPMNFDNHADASTVGEYLKCVLQELWINGYNISHGFDDDWDWQIIRALIENNLVEGAIDDDGEINQTHDQKVETNNLLNSAIDFAFQRYIK